MACHCGRIARFEGTSVDSGRSIHPRGAPALPPRRDLASTNGSWVLGKGKVSPEDVEGEAQRCEETADDGRPGDSGSPTQIISNPTDGTVWVSRAIVPRPRGFRRTAPDAAHGFGSSEAISPRKWTSRRVHKSTGVLVCEVLASGDEISLGVDPGSWQGTVQRGMGRDTKEEHEEQDLRSNSRHGWRLVAAPAGHMTCRARHGHRRS